MIDLICSGVNGGMYPLGYAKPVPQPAMAERVGSRKIIPAMRMDDERLQLDHNLMVLRARGVDSGQLDAYAAGCKGMSPVPAYLDYVDYKNIFLLPAFHALVYGIGKSFLNFILEVS